MITPLGISQGHQAELQSFSRCTWHGCTPAHLFGKLTWPLGSLSYLTDRKVNEHDFSSILLIPIDKGCSGEVVPGGDCFRNYTSPQELGRF